MHMDESPTILNESRTPRAQSRNQENRASESYELVTYEFVIEWYKFVTYFIIWRQGSRSTQSLRLRSQNHKNDCCHTYMNESRTQMNESRTRITLSQIQENLEACTAGGLYECFTNPIEWVTNSFDSVTKSDVTVSYDIVTNSKGFGSTAWGCARKTTRMINVTFMNESRTQINESRTRITLSRTQEDLKALS